MITINSLFFHFISRLSRFRCVQNYEKKFMTNDEKKELPQSPLFSIFPTSSVSPFLNLPNLNHNLNFPFNLFAQRSHISRETSRDRFAAADEQLLPQTRPQRTSCFCLQRSVNCISPQISKNHIYRSITLPLKKRFFIIFLLFFFHLICMFKYTWNYQINNEQNKRMYNSYGERKEHGGMNETYK